MSPVAGPLDTAAALRDLSAAIVSAVEAEDLDGAERLLAERGRLLAACAASGGARPAALVDAARAALAMDGRSRGVLGIHLASLGAELGGLATGAAALRGYGPPDGSRPAFIDRHD
jgi:hypothetical protein